MLRSWVSSMCAFVMLFSSQAAWAGAWTQDAHQWLIISSSDYAQALDGYDGKARADAPIRFTKVSARDLIEYGWNDRLTLFLNPEYIVAQSRWDQKPPLMARALSIEAGARYRILDSFGVLSVQSSYRSSGAFDLPNSRGFDAANIVEGRVLYGTNFTLLGIDGFGDIEMAERYVSHPRPNETVLDFTGGIKLGRTTQVMLQSFNIVSGGDWNPPDTYFRTHKIELSVVQRLTPKWSVQAGAYISPAGQNALVEQGVTVAVWTRF